ncbi:MAG: TonB-dependent receptor [Thermoanaerobaculia bacterium]
MKRFEMQFRALALALAAMLVVASGTLFAQAQAGNVYGSVVDDKGQPLPGVTLTLSGVGPSQAQVSDAQGQFRFPGLPPSTYKLEATLEGFSSVVFETVVVNVNRNTTINVTLQPAIEETITVTAESPLLDTRKISTGATVDKTELEKIPSARDPWVILQTTPGVLVDRVNVGGNESGQQSAVTGPGDDGVNTTWSVDGVEITDVGAIGSSTSYFDFDAFEEMQVATGGSDATARTGGVGLNMVTKRGTNEWRGGGRYIYDNDSLQSNFAPSASDFGRAGAWNLGNAQTKFKAGNRIQKVQDYGLELGGPLVKDRLWVWGSYGKNKIHLLTVSDFQDNTELTSWNAKLNGQIAANNSATFFVFNNDKTKIGRNAGPTRPQETTWNQSDLKSDPTLFALFADRPDVAKIEDTHIFGSDFFLTGMYSEGDGGFTLTPQGGIGPNRVNAALEALDGHWHNTFVDYKSPRPQDQYKLDGSYFFATGSLNHELKFGANYRKATVESFSRWPGFGRDLTVGGIAYYTYLYADGILNYDVKYKNAYVQDTITVGNLTANVGLRYDVQSGRHAAAVSAANPVRPDLMPEIRYAGGSAGFDDWKTMSPRLGLTYALGAEKKTLLRASYSRFADQLDPGAVAQTYPIYPSPYAYFYVYDLNRNGHAEANEIGALVGFGNGYNPEHPSEVSDWNLVDENLNAPYTDEVVLGVEHALLPEFVLGLSATLRRHNDIQDFHPLVFRPGCGNPKGCPDTADDYYVSKVNTVVLPDGKTRQVPIYSLKPGIHSNGGTFLTNGDGSQDYKGVSLTFNKRLSHQWMMRGNFTWSDWTWNLPSSAVRDPQEPFGAGNKDGDAVLVCSGNGSGSKANVCVNSTWSYSMSGMYQVAPDRPWGFNLSAALNGHQGYADPYYIKARRSGFPTSARNVTVTASPDEFRNDDVHVLDLRLEKEIRFERFGVTLGVDCFNALNASTVLQRELRLSYPTAASPGDQRATGDHVLEVLSPRIFRLGARFSFN